ncbi:MAG: CAAX amino protease [Saprospiraceae bacterium]|nr:MAG: CAAX amino protease [Saprospiraceae bacterium]
MQYRKPAIDIAAQIQLLEGRGLTIADQALALHYLSYISYYRLAGYWWPLQADKNDHTFKPGSNFQTVINLYNFDRELRLMVFNMIERIEIGIRTQMVYHLSEAYGPWWFEEERHFKKKHLWQQHLVSIKKEVGRSREVFILEHTKKYNGDRRCPPAWKSLEVISLGLLSKLFENLRNNLPEKKQIVENLHLGNHTFLSSWLRSISVVRNICAHHSRLWNKNLPMPPKLLTRADLPWIRDPSTIEIHSFYAVLVCMYYLVQTISPRNHFKKRLKALLEKYPNIDIKAMGFSVDWKEEPMWQ